MEILRLSVYYGNFNCLSFGIQISKLVLCQCDSTSTRRAWERQNGHAIDFQRFNRLSLPRLGSRSRNPGFANATYSTRCCKEKGKGTRASFVAFHAPRFRDNNSIADATICDMLFLKGKRTRTRLATFPEFTHLTIQRIQSYCTSAICECFLSRL